MQTKIAGTGLIAAGVAINNWALLRAPSAGGGPEAAGSLHLGVAAGGVILIAAGLLILLRLARSVSRPQRG
jgi:hypothetical protein